MLVALLAVVSVSAPAAQTARVACPLPAAEVEAIRQFTARGAYDDAIGRLAERKRARRLAGAPALELACLEADMADVMMAWNIPGSAAYIYQAALETFGGRIPPEQRSPPVDPEDDPDPVAVSVDGALARAGGVARLDDPVIDSIAERLVEAWIANEQALEVDGLAQTLLARRRARLGPDSASAMASLAAVVEVERRLNRWDAAMPASADLVARLTRLKGPTAPETLRAGATQAAILVAGGREVDGARLARRIQSEAGATLGLRDPVTLTARLVAAQAEVLQARPPSLAELEALSRDAAAALGSTHTVTLDAETLAIGGLLRAGRWPDAEARATTHYVRVAKARGPTDTGWMQVSAMRAEAILRQGRYAEAGPMYGEASTLMAGRLTPAHPLPLGASIGWGRSLMGPPAASRFDLQHAERIFDTARNGYDTLGLTDQRDEARGWRGRARLRLGRPDEAYDDLVAATSAVWKRQADPSRIATTEAAGELLRENRTLFMLSVEAGWRWANTAGAR